MVSKYNWCKTFFTKNYVLEPGNKQKSYSTGKHCLFGWQAFETRNNCKNICLDFLALQVSMHWQIAIEKLRQSFAGQSPLWQRELPRARYRALCSLTARISVRISVFTVFKHIWRREKPSVDCIFFCWQRLRFSQRDDVHHEDARKDVTGVPNGHSVQE